MARPFLPKELKRSKSLQIRFTKEEKSEIKKICKQLNISISQYLRDAIQFQYQIKIK